MSGDDDTFDLDIYGDGENQQQQQQQEENPEDRIDFGDDTFDNNGNGCDGQQDTNTAPKEQEDPSSTQAVAAGQKRKAPDDAHDDHQTPSAAAPTHPPTSAPPSVPPASSAATAQVDPNATLALKLSDLHWWTTEEDLRSFCSVAGVEAQLVDIAFGEHKINGKSRGEAYLEFSTREACSAVKKAVEARDEPVKQEDGKVAVEGKRKNQFQVWYVDQRLGNTFKGRDSGQATKKDAGAYNSAPVRGGGGGGYQGLRGGFQARAGGGFPSRGGYPSRGGGYQQQQLQQQQQQQQNTQAFGMNGGAGAGYGNAGGYAGNPMMGGMMGNHMMAMGMGFRGGFGAGGAMMGGAMRGNFNARGGGYGGFRGGFHVGGAGPGFQQQQQGGFQQQQGYGMQAGGANKRPRQE